MCAGRVGAVRGCCGGVGACGGAGGWLGAARALRRRLSLRKVAGADLIDSALYSALAHAKCGGNGADGVPGGKRSDDRAVDVVSGCGLDSGAGGGYVFGAADGGGCDAWQVVQRRLCVVVAVCVCAAGELAAIGRVAVLGAADYVRGLSAGRKEYVCKGVRLVALLVAGEGRRDAGPCVSGYGLRVVRGAYPLRIGCASVGLGAVLYGPGHADQRGILFLAAHVLPLATGCCGGVGGSVRLFQAKRELRAAAGFRELCDGGAVEAPRLPHDLGFTHGYDLLYSFYLMGRGRFGARCGSARVSRVGAVPSEARL